MGLKASGADLAFKGGLHAGTKYIGLIDSSDAEFSGNSYARQSISGFDQNNGWKEDGAEYENQSLIQFPQPTGGAWPAIAKWGLWDAQTSGNLLYDVDVSPDTAAPQIGADVEAAAEALGWSFTGVPNAGSIAAMKSGLLSGTRYITLHTGNPGTTGANVIFTDGVVWNGSNQGSKTVLAVQAAAADWDIDTSSTNRRARNNKALSYGAQSADLPDPTHVALRDGNAHNSGVVWSSTLTSPDPALGSTLRFLANGISIQLAIDT